jgi:hypothetical protein
VKDAYITAKERWARKLAGKKMEMLWSISVSFAPCARGHNYSPQLLTSLAM